MKKLQSRSWKKFKCIFLQKHWLLSNVKRFGSIQRSKLDGTLSIDTNFTVNCIQIHSSQWLNFKVLTGDTLLKVNSPSIWCKLFGLFNSTSHRKETEINKYLIKNKWSSTGSSIKPLSQWVCAVLSLLCPSNGISNWNYNTKLLLYQQQNRTTSGIRRSSTVRLQLDESDDETPIKCSSTNYAVVFSKTQNV